jgi:FSR family fosmidomycin resistance protein-like MFS transporter
VFTLLPGKKMHTRIKSSTGNARYQTTVLILGIAHGFSDAAAGYLFGSLSHDANFIETGSAVMIYNVVAFGGQLPAGIWLDRIGHYRKPAVLSLLGMILALWLLSCHFLWIAIAIAGLSSAIFHVAGGAVTIAGFPEKSRFVGVFSAFGVMGLALGGWAATRQWDGVSYWLEAGLAVLLISLLKANFPLARNRNLPAPKPQLDNHDYLMILLLMAIALRSAVWNVIQLCYAHQYDWLLYLAMAAMAGKLLGGWLTDHIPWKPYALTALSIALPALGWGYRKLFWLLLGTGLLQSLTPMSVIALQRLWPGVPATVSGAAFGLAIAIGGLINFVPFSTPSFQLILFGLLVGILYYAFLSADKPLSTRNRKFFR